MVGSHKWVSLISNLLFSVKHTFLYVLSRMTWIHSLLPKSLRKSLRVGWNFHMFWTTFISGGTRICEDYDCELEQPVGMTFELTL